MDADATHFYVTCPFWANNLLDSLPDKRWSKPKKAWRVPALTPSIDALCELSKLPNVTWTQAANALAAHQKVKSERRGKRGAGFPAWYKYKTEPRKHQRVGNERTYGIKTFYLYMGLQTGKSKTAMDNAVAHRMEGHVDAVLVLTKRTLRRNWLKQFTLHCPIPWDAYLPGKVEVMRRWLARRPDFPVLIVGWESLSQGSMGALVLEYCRSRKVFIIGDEGTYIANDKSIRTDWAYKFRDESEYRCLLSGTPALEGPMNLFSQFKFLDPDIIGIDDFLAFRNRYAIMGGYQREVRPGVKVPTQIVGYQNLDELMGRIAPYIYEVDKKDAYDLPPKRPVRYTVELTKEQRKIYDLVKREGILQMNEDDPGHVMQNCLETTLRLSQIAGGYAVKPRTVTRMGKDGQPKVKTVYDPVEIVPPEENPKFIEMMGWVEEWRKTKQGLIWATHMPEVRAMVKLLKGMGLRVVELHGEIDERLRQPAIDEFERGGFDLLVGSPGTGGMGYSMMWCEMNGFVSNSFRAIDRVQAEDRNWGDGQKATSVAVADFVAEKTVDDQLILPALEAKMDVSEYIKHRVKEFTRILDGESE